MLKMYKKIQSNIRGLYIWEKSRRVVLSRDFFLIQKDMSLYECMGAPFHSKGLLVNLHEKWRNICYHAEIKMVFM